mmetsp:Transcript_138817/g.387126  ORF Transcript_138817/g.387126 Transcript_138817/m.387126 type:complete len:222 (-) Transcript_138817:1421-2086(-)
MAPIIHGRPRPKKTFTELLPVTLPMLASAYMSCTAAVLEANVSGNEVPKATMVMAVAKSGMLMAQPSMVAKSPMRMVTMAIMNKATPKQTQPPPYSTGGTSAKKTFQGRAMKWMAQSSFVASASPSSSPLQHMAAENCSLHLVWPTFIWSWFSLKALMTAVPDFPVGGTMKTVRMAESLPPSVVSSNMALPEESLRITRKASLPSMCCFGRMFTWNLAECC